VRPALEAFCAEPGVESLLCDCDGPCVPALPGDQCADAVGIDPVSQVLEGDMALFAADTSGSCGGAGRERVWTFTTDRVMRFTARSSGYDSVLYLRLGCAGAELACNDDVDRDTDRGSRIERNLGPATYALFLDAYDQEVATYTLTLTFDAIDDDAGVPTPDSGAPARDAGRPDAGSDAADAGSEPPAGGGCGCRTAGSAGSSLPLLFVGAWMFHRRRLHGR